jgi:alkylation response protein AidB-like acyl-CoA dehydrogenase
VIHDDHRLFGDEHEMLRRTVPSFAEKEVVPHVDAGEEAGEIPRALWQRLGELGFLGLEFPPRAVRRGDHYVRTESKSFVTNGVHGDLYFVAARTGGGSGEPPPRRRRGPRVPAARRWAPARAHHGCAYGYMGEFPVERFFRDVRLRPIASGTSEMMREIIARRLLS